MNHNPVDPSSARAMPRFVHEFDGRATVRILTSSQKTDNSELIETGFLPRPTDGDSPGKGMGAARHSRQPGAFIGLAATRGADRRKVLLPCDDRTCLGHIASLGGAPFLLDSTLFRGEHRAPTDFDVKDPEAADAVGLWPILDPDAGHGRAHTPAERATLRPSRGHPSHGVTADLP